MTKNKINYILFDAANTLIHKPLLWYKMNEVLMKENIHVDIETLKYHHKLLSEIINFPDKTSKEFYTTFNTELLLSLGVVPQTELLNEIFEACSYLPWEIFDDVQILSTLSIPMGILSNFNKTLAEKINEKLFGVFKDIIISEDVGMRKPDTRFYEFAINSIGELPENILYIGDSLKLDIIPATKVGMQVALIDRENRYAHYAQKINTFAEITNYLS